MSADTLALELKGVVDEDKVNTFDTIPMAYRAPHAQMQEKEID